MKDKVLILVLLPLLGCVDPFETPSDASNSNVLVVEGHIGDEFTQIRLSRSANLDSLEVIAESDAQVFVENELGSSSMMLNNYDDGSYAIEESLNFNERYRVRIETADGDTYVSDFVPLLRTPEIQEINLELDTPSTQLEFKLSTGDLENETQYYRWDYIETWEYTSVYTSQLQYVDGEIIQRSRENDISTCWMTEISSNIILETSVALDANIVSNKPILGHVLGRNERFKIGYSVIIRQYALTEEEFEFWTLLEKNTETFGTLFDPQPSQLITNVTCITNPARLVLGYVGASSIEEQRVNIRRGDLPEEIPIFRFNLSECPILGIGLDQASIDDAFGGGIVPLFADFGVIAGTSRLCADCRARGGTTVRPDFWF